MSLREPHFISSPLDSTFTTDTSPSLGIPPSKPEENIGFRLGDCSDSIIYQIVVDEMRALIFDAYNVLLPQVSTPMP